MWGITASSSIKKNREIAKGLVNYSNYELNKIKGENTSHIKKILGYKTFDEAIHRNNMVILNG